MLALNITDRKDFMSKLLVRDIFDSLLLVEASITTFNTFTIDGTLQDDFFDTDALELLKKEERSYSLWREQKAFCYSIIRGKHSPLHFKIVFQLSRRQIIDMLEHTSAGITPDNVAGLWLNLQYKNNVLLCTTGTSQRTFSLDKRLDQLWDSMVLDFFKKMGISYEQM